jgi:peptidoglycan/LPS O-acetylase OafA/YrhL
MRLVCGDAQADSLDDQRLHEWCEVLPARLSSTLCLEHSTLKRSEVHFRSSWEVETEIPVQTRSPIHTKSAIVPATSRIPELDGLRGIAILLVVVWHYFYYKTDQNYHPVGFLRNLYAHVNPFLGLGWSGVDLFFVLSGFLIGGILLDVRTSQHYFKTFYLRRFYRIIPIYYVWILAYVLLMAIAGTFLRTHIQGGNEPDAKYQTLVQLLFLQNFGILGYAPIARAWLSPTWSLAVEEQFYLLAPLVIRYLSKQALRVLLAVVIFTAPLLRVVFYYHFPRWNSDIALAYTLTACRADALAIGIFAALLWRTDAVRAWLTVHGRFFYGLVGGFGLGVVALGRWAPSPFSIVQTSVGYTWIALFYASTLLLAIAKPAGPIAWLARMPWLRELGRVSYCVYLIHLAVVVVLFAVLNATLGHLTGLESFVGNVLAAILSYTISVTSWSYFEHPILRIGCSFKY